MLIEGVCENYALNVCNWCVKSSLFEQDVFIRQTQLLLMHKFGHVNEFHNQVSDGIPDPAIKTSSLIKSFLYITKCKRQFSHNLRIYFILVDSKYVFHVLENLNIFLVFTVLAVGQ